MNGEPIPDWVKEPLSDDELDVSMSSNPKDHRMAYEIRRLRKQLADANAERDEAIALAKRMHDAITHMTSCDGCKNRWVDEGLAVITAYDAQRTADGKEKT